jgi:hypothetical protein
LSEAISVARLDLLSKLNFIIERNELFQLLFEVVIIFVFFVVILSVFKGFWLGGSSWKNLAMFIAFFFDLVCKVIYVEAQNLFVLHLLNLVQSFNVVDHIYPDLDLIFNYVKLVLIFTDALYCRLTAIFTQQAVSNFVV